VWLLVPDTTSFNKVADQITKSPLFSNPSVKVETSSSSIAVFLEAYRDLLWGARWILSPSILLTLSLIIANAIAISVRERETEFAVMKVLGFRPNQLLILVILEALIVGVTAGFLSSGGTYFLVNDVAGGIPFPIAFFNKFMIPEGALWWGPVVGGLTALAGSLAPALSARSVRVANVFSKVNG
jgi:putative ABC transport system permease protein